MKFKSLTLALVAAATITVGCAKKAPAPGAAPTASENTPSKQGVQPTGGDEKIVAKETEGGSTPQEGASLLDGGWESSCVKTRYTTNPQPHVTELYESYRYYITISKGALLEQLFYFKGDSCASYTHSIESGEGDIWFFDILQDGALNGSPYQVNYTDYNFESTGGIEGMISLKEVNGKQAIVFDDSELTFVRDN